MSTGGDIPPSDRSRCGKQPKSSLFRLNSDPADDDAREGAPAPAISRLHEAAAASEYSSSTPSTTDALMLSIFACTRRICSARRAAALPCGAAFRTSRPTSRKSAGA